MNQRFCEITGYARDELATKTFLDITYKEDVENNLNLYSRLLMGEVNEYFYERRYVRKNGQIIWLRLAVTAVRTTVNIHTWSYLSRTLMKAKSISMLWN